jgi:uncharacterized protein YndB with AHSA1/START domain
VIVAVGRRDMTDNTLRIERTFQAPAQAVFDAWTSEEVMRRWWHAEHDWETTEAEVDLRVGGVVRVVMRNPDEDVEYGGGGRYTEIEPPTRLAFTWIWDNNATRQLIELDFEEADGVTTVRFTHSGLWDEEAVRSHEGGWNRAPSTTSTARSRRRREGSSASAARRLHGVAPAPAEPWLGQLGDGLLVGADRVLEPVAERRADHAHALDDQTRARR